MSCFGSFPFNFLNPNTDSNKSFSTTSLLTWRSWMIRLPPPAVVALFGGDEGVDAIVREGESSAAISTGSCWSIESEIDFFRVGEASLPPLVVFVEVVTIFKIMKCNELCSTSSYAVVFSVPFTTSFSQPTIFPNFLLRTVLQRISKPSQHHGSHMYHIFETILCSKKEMCLSLRQTREKLSVFM
jgi:hypothetical protein